MKERKVSSRASKKRSAKSSLPAKTSNIRRKKGTGVHEPLHIPVRPVDEPVLNLKWKSNE